MFKLFRILFFCTLFLIINHQIIAQPNLPNMSIVTENGANILIWNSTYDGVKSVAIQRSNDSIRNFVTIGFISAPKKGAQKYIDNRPVVGKNFYRLYLLFPYEVEWYSNTYKVIMDSALIARSMGSTYVTGSTNANSSETTAGGKDFYYVPSSRVFTNPYTGHINFLLENAATKRYGIRFFDPKKNEVLRINRISVNSMVLDKRNFNARGTFFFQLFDGTTMIETGYVTIY